MGYTQLNFKPIDDVGEKYDNTHNVTLPTQSRVAGQGKSMHPSHVNAAALCEWRRRFICDDSAETPTCVAFTEYGEVRGVRSLPLPRPPA